MPRQHKVRQGDDIASIAAKYGFVPDTIWDDPANKTLKEKRKDPNTLFRGDIVMIPDMRTKEMSCSTEQRHRFRKKGGARLWLRFLDGDDPLSGEKYVLDVGGIVKEGQTDGGGWIDEPVPANVQRGVLYLGERRRTFRLNFGHIDPVDEVSGAQERLRNLGIYSGNTNGKLTDETIDALRGFQKKYNLQETGQLDQGTQDELIRQHGG